MRNAVAALLLIVVIGPILLYPNVLVSAQTSSTDSASLAVEPGFSRIDPSSPFYFLKGVREMLELKLALTDHVKVIRHLEFSQRRVKEINTLVRGRNQWLIQPTLERYWAEIERIDYPKIEPSLKKQTDMILSKNLGFFTRIYQGLSDPTAKMAIRAVINRMLQRQTSWLSNGPKLTPTELVNQTLACDLLRKESSSSALNDSEKQILEERAQKCVTGLRVLIH